MGFGGARVATSSGYIHLPIGWATRPAAEGEKEGWLYVVRDDGSSERPPEASVTGLLDPALLGHAVPDHPLRLNRPETIYVTRRRVRYLIFTVYRGD